MKFSHRPYSLHKKSHVKVPSSTCKAGDSIGDRHTCKIYSIRLCIVILDCIVFVCNEELQKVVHCAKFDKDHSFH